MKIKKISFIIVNTTVFLLISLACFGSTAKQLESAVPQQVLASQPVVINPDPEPPRASQESEITPEPEPDPEAPITILPEVKAEPLVIMAKGFGQNKQDLGYGFKVTNPNKDLAVENSQYQVAFYNAEGKVVETESYFIELILPGQQLGIANLVYLDEGITVAKMEVQLSDGDAIATELTDTFTTENVTYVPTEYYSTANGVINNPYNKDLTSLRVSAILYDEAGEIIGGGNSYINFILANSSTGVIVPVSGSNNVSRVEIYPALSGISMLDISEQVPEGAGNLVMTKQGFGQNNTSIGIGMIIENPNQDYAIEFSMYQTTSYSDDGSILGISQGSINLLLPTQTLGIADIQSLGDGITVSKVDIQILAGNYTESKIIPTFTSENVTFIPDQYSPQVTGEIANPYGKDVSNIRVDAIAYNETGDIIGSGISYVNFIPANAKAAVSVYVTVAGTPAKVELYATPSVLSDIES